MNATNTMNTAIVDLAAADAVEALNAATTEQETVIVYSDPSTAAKVAADDEMTITQRWKNPARAIAVNIPATPWTNVEKNVSAAYAPLLAAVLEGAAKRILKRHIEAYSATPSTLKAALFNEAALLDEATNGASEWLSKEELTSAWESSVTRQRLIVNNPKYRASAEYRRAANYYAELILKLAGKTSAYKIEDLDWMLAKMADEDLNTEFGAFVARRIEALRNKPQAATTIDRDIL